MIAANSSLKELDLSSNGATTGSGTAFSHEFSIGLQANLTLTSLNLAKLGLKAEGAESIAKALKFNVSATFTFQRIRLVVLILFLLATIYRGV
jgi:hypothetical protein